MVQLGTGMGWRPEIAGGLAALPDLQWVEVVAESVCPDHLPQELTELRARRLPVVPHGVSLGLGGAERPSPARLMALARVAEVLEAPLVTEHIAFVRAGGPLGGGPRLEAGHLLPVPRTWDALDVLCANVRIAQDALPVPLALENVAALFSWPGEELTEAQFLTELVERTGVRLLIDVANLYANHVNRGEDPARLLAGLPLDALAYVHVAGGVMRDGVWHDSHAHPVPEAVLDVLASLCARTVPPGVLLERDDAFPDFGELARELRRVDGVVRAASAAGGQGRGAGGLVGDHGLSLSPSDGWPGVAGRAGAGGGVRSAEEAVRGRLAVAQAALLGALVADGPLPAGFDEGRLGVQREALVVKRVRVMARSAPGLVEALGGDFRAAARWYVRGFPLVGGYRQSTVAFAEELSAGGFPLAAAQRRRVRRWLRGGG